MKFSKNKLEFFEKNHSRVKNLVRILFPPFFIMAGIIILSTSLSGCGGGSSGGSSPTASTISGNYNGGTTLAFFKLPKFLDSVYASSSYSPKTFTLSLEAGGNFSIIDDQGNLGSGTFTLNGTTVSLSGILYINHCTPSSTVVCNYIIKNGAGGLSIGSGTVSGTIDLYTNSSSTTPYASTSIGLTSVNLPSVSISKIEGQTFTYTYTVGGSNPTDCSSPYLFYGSTEITLNGQSLYMPCVTADSIPANTESTINGTQERFYPTSNVSYNINLCPSLGQSCFPSGWAQVTVPPGDLGFYASCPSPAGGCLQSNVQSIDGYIVPSSGNNGGIIGKMVVPPHSWAGCSMPEDDGVVSVLSSTSGTITGSWFFGLVIPAQSTYSCTNNNPPPATSTYEATPIQFVFSNSTTY